MNKKKLLIVFPAILALVGVSYFLVSNQIVKAQENQAENEQTVAEEQIDKLVGRLEKEELRLEKAPVSMMITPGKKVTFVNVSLDGIEGTDLTVKIFGLAFKVDASTAKIYGGGKDLTLSDLKVGDKLLIKGTIDENTGKITATRIHDRSVHKTAITNLRARIEELTRLLEQLRARLRGQ